MAFELGMKKFVEVFLVVVVATVILAGCTTQQADSGSPKATIGLQLTPTSTLIQIADEKGFFKKNGVEVEIKEFTAGKLALQAMLSSSVDFASPADVPVLLAKAQGNELYTLAEIASNKSESPLVVKDDGSRTVEEYFSKKRKIATSIGGSPEFSLYMFMKTYKIPKENMDVVPLKPEEMIWALSSGSVDGIVIFEPYPTLAEEKIPGLKVFKLPDGVYTTKYLFVGNKQFVDRAPETAWRIVKSLSEAEAFLSANPEESKDIVARKTGFDRQIMDKIFADFEFGLRAPTSALMQNWHNEFAWALDTNKTQAISEPDMTQTFTGNIAAPA